MPIRPELRRFYRTGEWRQARARVMERAGGKCEWCKAPNHTAVLRAYEWWTPANIQSTVFMERRGRGETPRLEWHSRVTVMSAGFPWHKGMRWAGIVLGVAHLDHNPENNADDNLAALCQRCHLIYDGPHHRATARLRRDAETGQLRLELVEGAA